MLLGSHFSFAQQADTLKVKQRAHSPKKAAIFSACLPGLGQAYNKRYWKMPIIYAGFGGLGYVFVYNQSRFSKYRDAYKIRLDNDASTVDDYVGVYTDDNLLELKNYFHRYRDLTVVGGLVLYTLNIVDAAVDAHLFTFDVSDNLSLRVLPFAGNSLTCGPVKGLGFVLSF